MRPKDQVVVAQVGAAHGIKGEVRLKSFTETPMDVAGYSPLMAADGRRFEIEAAREAAGSSPSMLVVRFRGVGDRTAAEALNGIELSVPRDSLPEVEADEYYHADLIGLTAVARSGATLGMVVAIRNHGAGDILEIAPAQGAPLMVPFTRAVVPEVDMAAGRVVIDPPPGLIDDRGRGRR